MQRAAEAAEKKKQKELAERERLEVICFDVTDLFMIPLGIPTRERNA